MLVVGVLILLAAWPGHRAFQAAAVPLSISLLGLSLIGVGVSSLIDPLPHVLITLLALYAAAFLCATRWVVALSALTVGVLAEF